MKQINRTIVQWLRLFAGILALLPLCLASYATAQTRQSPSLHRGINLSSWFANAPRQILDEKDFRQIKELGFDFVRLPVNPEMIGFKLDGDFGQLQNLDLPKVDRAISGLTRLGITVILDIHPGKDFMDKLEQGGTEENQFIALWKTLAAHYQAYPNKQLAFELLNEPQYYGKFDVYDNFIARVVKNIRETQPNRTLIVETPNVSSSQPIDHLKATAIIHDQNVVYDVHYYEPGTVTHQGATWVKNGQLRFFNSIPYPSSLVDLTSVRPALGPGADPDKAMETVSHYVAENWNRERIDTYLNPAAQWAKDNHVRLLVLEFGVLRTRIDPASRMRWIKDTRQVMDNLGLPWAYWDYSDLFGIMKLVGKTITDPYDGSIRFAEPADPKNQRIADPEAIEALGLTPESARN